MKLKLWSDDKTEDDIEYHANNDSDNVIFNLLEDIKCLKECVDEISEADCMGEISKTLRQYGIDT